MRVGFKVSFWGFTDYSAFDGKTAHSDSTSLFALEHRLVGK